MLLIANIVFRANPKPDYARIAQGTSMSLGKQGTIALHMTNLD
jgi:hypothetical protein